MPIGWAIRMAVVYLYATPKRVNITVAKIQHLMKSFEMEIKMLTKNECLIYAVLSFYSIILTIAALMIGQVIVAILFSICAIIMAYVPMVIDTLQD
jgi:hypothetical protein